MRLDEAQLIAKQLGLEMLVETLEAYLTPKGCAALLKQRQAQWRRKRALSAASQEFDEVAEPRSPRGVLTAMRAPEGYFKLRLPVPARGPTAYELVFALACGERLARICSVVRYLVNAVDLGGAQNVYSVGK